MRNIFHSNWFLFTIKVNRKWRNIVNQQLSVFELNGSKESRSNTRKYYFFKTRNGWIIFEITPSQDICRNDMSTVVQRVAILLSVYTVFLHHFMFLFLNLVFFVQYQMYKEVQYQLLTLKKLLLKYSLFGFVTGISRDGDAISESDDECVEKTPYSSCTRYFPCPSCRTRKTPFWKSNGWWWHCKVS